MSSSPSTKKRSLYRYADALKAAVSPDVLKMKDAPRPTSPRSPTANPENFITKSLSFDHHHLNRIHPSDDVESLRQAMAAAFAEKEKAYEERFFEIEARWQMETEKMTKAFEEISGIAIQLKEERDNLAASRQETAKELEEVLQIAMEIKDERDEIMKINDILERRLYSERQHVAQLEEELESQRSLNSQLMVELTDVRNKIKGQ
ncbi:hypothetical protein PROFUN_07043, partial [Planoprotostelium fungivorum]